MLCDNCKKNQANVKYSENINGVKKELNLCEECSQKLGITHMDFNMPINFSSFFGDFLEDFSTPEFMPLFQEVKELKCEACGSTFEDIVNSGKFGCGNCYEVFQDRIDPILKRIQGSNHHVGRLANRKNQEVLEQEKNENNEPNLSIKENQEITKLKQALKQAIQEERYEEAAKIRDEIKKKEN